MIVVEDLIKSIGGKPVLQGVNLRVSAGESFALIGRSGCGKSVLLRHILGLEKPDAGRVLIEGVSLDGRRADREKEIRLSMGVLFQQSALFDSLSVSENVGFALKIHGSLPVKEIDAKSQHLLSMVGLAGCGEKMPAELSGGMQKRAALARAISLNPRLLLLDEPTSGLDPITADAINKLVVKLKDSLKATVIIVTHDMASACMIADRIGLLDEGRIRAAGSAASMRASGDDIVRSFFRQQAR